MKSLQIALILTSVMSYDLIIAISIGLFALIVLWLRTNIALGILALTAGYVVNDLVVDNVYSILYGDGANDSSLVIVSAISIAIILLPSFLIIFRFKGFQPGRLLVHIAPAGAYGLLAVLFILISLPIETQAILREESFAYIQFEYFQALIVISSVVIAIFDLMAHERKLRRKNRKRRRSKED